MTPKEVYFKCLNENKKISELEEIIATDPGTSFHYAKFVIKKTFHLGHFNIFNSCFKDNYIDFLKSINCDMIEISEWLI